MPRWLVVLVTIAMAAMIAGFFVFGAGNMGTEMARPPVEEGEGAPTFRPLWMLLPYLWPKGQPELRLRVFAAIFFLILATAATSVSPLFYGWAVDALAKTPATIALGVALTWVGAYTASRILLQAFAQLRDGIFAKVQYHAMREVSVKTFAHVHTLSLRFHLERKTGGLSRIIERGIKGIDTLLSFTLFSIFPTILLLVFYSVILFVKLNLTIALITVAMVGGYVWFTFAITNWRIQFRARHERERSGRQHQGRGQPSQLRDGEIFQQ